MKRIAARKTLIILWRNADSGWEDVGDPRCQLDGHGEEAGAWGLGLLLGGELGALGRGEL